MTLRKQFNSSFSACGFILDDTGTPVLLMAEYPVVSDQIDLTPKNILYSTFPLDRLESIARHFEKEHGPENNIFSGAPEAIQRSHSLGYACYQAYRILQRIDQKDKKEVEYHVPLDIVSAEKLIHETIMFDEEITVRYPIHREIMLANQVDAGRYQSMVKASAPEAKAA